MVFNLAPTSIGELADFFIFYELVHQSTHQINPMLWSQHKHFYNRLLTGCILGLSLISTPLALAEYQPPDSPSAPSCTDKTACTGTGPRGGCSAQSKTSLTALAPQSHIGKTMSNSPIVAWFVPDSESLPLEFSLYESEGNDEREIMRQNLQSKPGIMSLSLPNLEVGKRYRWQVVLICNPDRPSNSLVAEAIIELVAPSSALKAKIEATNDSLTKANIYAESGFWYDALGETLAETEDKKSEDLMLSLLEDLASVEGREEGYQQHSKQLEEIIEEERQSSR